MRAHDQPRRFAVTWPPAFQSQTWFELLLQCGLERPPVGVHALHLMTTDGQFQAHLPCMQTHPRGHLRSLSNYYAGWYGPVLATGGDLSVVDWAAAARLAARLPGAWMIEMASMGADDAWVMAWRRGLASAGYVTDTYFSHGNWYLPCAPWRDFDHYWQARPSKLRHTVDRARKRLDRDADWSLEIIRDDADPLALARGIEAFEAVYADSWKSAEPNPAFMPSLMRAAASAACLRLGVLRVGGVAVAAQLWLVDAGKACIYKLAYREDAARWSAGSVLTAALMRHVIEVDQVQEVDYLMGDEPYKRDWMTHRRERIGLVAFRWRDPRGLWACARHHAGRWLRRLKSPATPASG